jgi:protein TonB
VNPPIPALEPVDTLSAAQRRGLVVGMLGVHLAAAWALLQLEPVRQAVGEIAPVFVDWVAPPTEVPPAPPPPPPPKPLPKRVEPVPLVTAAPSPAPAPFVAPPPPPEPPVVAVEAPPPAPPTPPAPVAPPPPKTVAITAVEYLTPPQLNYPAASRRLREEGAVHVRVLVDPRGTPQQLQLVRSSGSTRLDEAALATVRATRFKPYTENGVALPFWVVMPLIFELEN